MDCKGLAAEENSDCIGQVLLVQRKQEPQRSLNKNNYKYPDDRAELTMQANMGQKNLRLLRNQTSE